MKHYLYILIICFIIAIWVATFIGCDSLVEPDCSARTVSDNMTMIRSEIPCRIAVGRDHVATQILKDGEWGFLHREDRRLEVIEYVTLQAYLKYLIVYYDALLSSRATVNQNS